jgi:cell wall-associated NlpC family hydrolase
MRYLELPYTWGRIQPCAGWPKPRNMPIDAETAILRVLSDWRGTPYESGQRFKGRGADCLGAVFGVLDDLDERDRSQYPDLPPDTALHNRGTALAAMKRVLTRYPDHVLVSNNQVEPGDIIVSGEVGGGPGHVAIVGGKNQVWQAIQKMGFGPTGWSLFGAQKICAVYRPTNKWEWAKCYYKNTGQL